MSHLFEDTPQKELVWLLRQIHERELALPNFQRDFVWEPYDVQTLIVSIANSYPAGSILAIRNTHNYFASREISSAPVLKNHQPTYLILDGQQRLTSLYQAFYGNGEYLYFLDINTYLESDDIEDALFYIRTSARGQQQKLLQKYSSTPGQAEFLILPLHVLFSGKDGYLGWMDEISEYIGDTEKRKAIRNKLRKIRNNIIVNIENYKFPVTLLSDTTPIEAVCTIFETLNRTGVKLGIFDLLVARFWPEDVHLRSLWEESQRRFPILKDFRINPYSILQIISLLNSGEVPSCKRKTILNLSAKQVEGSWQLAATSLANALAILQQDCGVWSHKWLPNSSIVVLLAAVLAENSEIKGIQLGELRRKLVRWFWYSIFAQTYEKNTNFQISRDFQEIQCWIVSDAIPANLLRFSFDPSILYRTTPKQRNLYRGVIALILSQNPRDFYVAKPIPAELLEQKKVDDHHIFPNEYLRKMGVHDKNTRECVLNRTLIDRSTNRILHTRSPSEYFAELREKLGPEVYQELMESHILPTQEDSALLQDNYFEFLEWRKVSLSQMITKATS